MPTVAKIIQKMKQQPNGVRVEEAEKVLKHYGYSLARRKGSHRHYLNRTGDVITLRDPLKIAYVEDLLNRIGEGKEAKRK